MTDFGSLITAMVTPFKADDITQIDYKAVAKIIDHLIKTGSDSIIIAGTTGERPTLTHEEEDQLLAFAVEHVKSSGSDLKIIFGSGSNSTQTSIKYSQRAQEIGADGLLLVTPYYNKPNQKGMVKHS